MCGIFSCISNADIINKTLTGLELLEYRGYDSSGIAFIENKKIHNIRSIGNISKLKEKIIDTKTKSHITLGHTRWATHGKVSEKNTHPILSNNNNIAVVHNGIIENYDECKSLLNTNNLKLHTTVDTEIVPNILYMLRHNNHNIHDLHKYLTGHYAICACFNDEPESIFIAKKGNMPLHIGVSKNSIYITSDTLAFPNSVIYYTTLSDNETGLIRKDNMLFYKLGEPISKELYDFTPSTQELDKNGFTTFMEKEINEIPEIITKIINEYKNNPKIQKESEKFNKLINNTECLHICACGTSYHAGLIIGDLIEKRLRRRVRVHISSEFNKDQIINDKEMALVISQSGETADTLGCIDTLKALNIPIASLCNVEGSSIEKQSNIKLPLLCGPEVAVASTKVFVATILIGSILVGGFEKKHYDELYTLALQNIKQATKLIPTPAKTTEKIFFLGKGIDYFLSLESALKVKELTYRHCEGYAASELKHGPLSMIDANTLSIVYLSDTQNTISEISARNGKVIVLQDPAPNNPLSFIIRIIPAQLFSLRFATLLGLDSDKPRNLAKSVTVL